VPEPITVKDVLAGRREEVLVANVSITPGVFPYHPGRRQVLTKLRAFIDHVRSHLTPVPGAAQA
jgi:hypothetical protein